MRSTWASILRLLRLRGPSAIFRLVVPVVVDAIDAQIQARLVAHIRDEVLEVMAPSIADRNSTSSVIGEVCNVRIGASVDHGVPGAVLTPIRRSSEAISSTGVSVRDVVSSHLLSVVAAAACRRSIREAATDDLSCGSAIAAARPGCLSVPRSGERHDRPASVAMTGAINEAPTVGYRGDSHFGLLVGRLVRAVAAVTRFGGPFIVARGVA